MNSRIKTWVQQFKQNKARTTCDWRMLADIPNGFIPSGEFRTPLLGESYLTDKGVAKLCENQFKTTSMRIILINVLDSAPPKLTLKMSDSISLGVVDIQHIFDNKPEWAKYAAQDYSGDVFYFDEKPSLKKGQKAWRNNRNCKRLQMCNENWKETLIEF